MYDGKRETANLRRWWLLILNSIFFLGTFIPIYNDGVTVWNARNKQLVAGYNLGVKDLNILGKLMPFVTLVCAALLITVPILHIAKLLGLLGESRRNSRAISFLFSCLELISLLGIIVLFYSALNDQQARYSDRAYSITRFLTQLSTWTYIWVILIVLTLIISELLLYTEPVFPSLVGEDDSK